MRTQVDARVQGAERFLGDELLFADALCSLARLPRLARLIVGGLDLTAEAATLSSQP